MFTDRYFGKKRAKAAPDVLASEAAETNRDFAIQRSQLGEEPSIGPEDPAEPQRAGASAGESARREGLALEDYARLMSMTETEVWRRLRRGELVGRTHKGRLTIFSSLAAAEGFDVDLETLHERLAEAQSSSEPGAPFGAAMAGEAAPLPPLPHAAPEPARAGGFLALSGQQTHSPEMALLLDHLSLAKEENREILRLTQDSIRKVTELTESLVEMKDAVIEAKATQIDALKAQLDERDRQIKRLLQQQEDLEMLARTMMADR